MGENTPDLENLSEYLYRRGKRLPRLFRSRVLDHSLRLTMLASAGGLRQLEQHLQTLCSLVRVRYL